MKLSPSSALLVCFTSLALISCASERNKALDQKITNEPKVENTQALGAKVQSEINQDPLLSLDQKIKLTSLRENTSANLLTLREEYLKLRLILVKDFMDNNVNELKLVKKRIRNNNKKQMDVLFTALESANHITGKVPKNTRWVNEFMVDGRSASHDE